jgi:predicted TIM-barrel fold metal-dependent hydrolase
MYLLWKCVKVLGADRVLFGTNLPFSVPEAEMLKITHSSKTTVYHLSKEDQAMVLGGSAVRLHGITGC